MCMKGKRIQIIMSWRVWVSGTGGEPRDARCFLHNTVFYRFENGFYILASRLEVGNKIKAADGQELRVMTIRKRKAFELFELNTEDSQNLGGSGRASPSAPGKSVLCKFWMDAGWDINKKG